MVPMKRSSVVGSAGLALLFNFVVPQSVVDARTDTPQEQIIQCGTSLPVPLHMETVTSGSSSSETTAYNIALSNVVPSLERQLRAAGMTCAECSSSSGSCTMHLDLLTTFARPVYITLPPAGLVVCELYWEGWVTVGCDSCE
jgi:hypothetical protein